MIKGFICICKGQNPWVYIRVRQVLPRLLPDFSGLSQRYVIAPGPRSGASVWSSSLRRGSEVHPEPRFAMRGSDFRADVIPDPHPEVSNLLEGPAP